MLNSSTIYRKLVAATPGKGQMVSFSVMLTQMQERLIKKMQSEHDRTVTILNARADTRHNESKAMIERQARMIKELQVSVSKFALESETRDSAIMTGVANVSAQVANVSAQVALVDTELTALKRAAVELQPLACNQCTFVCTPEQYKQSADIIEGVRWWGCAMCKTSQVDERVPSETAAAELRVNGTANMERRAYGQKFPDGNIFHDSVRFNFPQCILFENTSAFRRGGYLRVSRVSRV